MRKLPVVSGEEAIRAFEKDDWAVARQESSHVTMKKPGVYFLLTVPLDKELDAGLLRRLIKDSGPTRKQFLELLK